MPHVPRSARAAITAAVLVAVVGCGVRRSADTRYQGILLNARNLGAEELGRQQAADPTIADWVTREGQPDFLLNASPTDVEIVYVRPSQLVHFHRPAPGAPSSAAVLSPLPDGVLAILPRDLRAGTPGPVAGVETGCWITSPERDQCRTCCRTARRCVIECRPQTSTVTPRQNAT